MCLSGGLPFMTHLALAFVRLCRSVYISCKDQEFRVLLLLMILTLVSGTVFYSTQENWSILDSLYFCVMTISTVGYGDYVPVTSLAKVFTIIYSFLGIGIFVGVVSKLTSNIINQRKSRL